MNLPILDDSYKWITLYAAFCVWILLITCLWSWSLLYHVSVLHIFGGWRNNYCMDTSRSVYSSTGLPCFYPSAIVNSAAMNMQIHVFVGETVCSSLRHLPRSVIVGSCGNSMLNYLRSCQSVLHNSCNFTSLPATDEGSNFSSSLSTLVLFFFFFFNSHSSFCERIKFLGFLLCTTTLTKNLWEFARNRGWQANGVVGNLPKEVPEPSMGSRATYALYSVDSWLVGIHRMWLICRPLGELFKPSQPQLPNL